MQVRATVTSAQASAVPEHTQTPPNAPTQPVDETGSLNDLTAGLEKLGSYRIDFSLSMQGWDAQGQLQSGDVIIQQVVQRTEALQFLSYSGAGTALNQAGLPESRFELITLDGIHYLYLPEEMSCTGVSVVEQTATALQILSLEDLIGRIENARLVEKGVLVGGITADHYTFDQSNLVEANMISASGEYWITQADGIVLGISGQARGRSPLFPGLEEVTQTWDYTMQPLDQAASIPLPEACLPWQPPSDMPLPENIVDPAYYSGMLTFTSPESPAQLADFYRSRLVEAGWILSSDQATDKSTLLEFQQGERSLEIVINRHGAAGSEVLVREVNLGE